ncbi:MAG: RraA family protein [Armatimonadetes bacterium]|nr:RraA family protein [Armatimonadota bacterium]
MVIDNILKLLDFDTPTVANGVELLEIRDPCVGYTGPDVRALMPDMGPRVGIAVTARMDTTTAGTDRPASLFDDWLRLIQKAYREVGGERLPVFAVIESVGPRPRTTVTIGDVMGTQMKLAGAAAFLTNGSIRDIEGVRGVPLPTWAAGLSPMHGRIRWLDINSPVVIDGMTVCPGDIVHADVNGAIVIPPSVADRAYEKALAVRQREAETFALLNRPGMTIEEYMKIRGV